MWVLKNELHFYIILVGWGRTQKEYSFKPFGVLLLYGLKICEEDVGDSIESRTDASESIIRLSKRGSFRSDEGRVVWSIICRRSSFHVDIMKAEEYLNKVKFDNPAGVFSDRKYPEVIYHYDALVAVRKAREEAEIELLCIKHDWYSPKEQKKFEARSCRETAKEIKIWLIENDLFCGEICDECKDTQKDFNKRFLSEGKRK